MPRNSSGTMSATAGQPAVAGTVISSATFNSLVADLIAELTDSASRSGKGGFTAPVRAADGTVAAPAHSFTSETGTGWYRAAAGDLRLAIAGVDVLKLTAAGLEIPIANPALIKATGSNTQLNLQGNRSGADANDEIVMISTATRTAGYLLGIWSNASVPVKKLQVDYQGLLSLASQAGPLQPASIWTAITPGGGWGAAGAGLAYWKDPTGLVHMKGTATWLTGATTMTTLPAGFRPVSNRQFPALNFSSGALMWISVVAASGAVALSAGAPSNNDIIYFDAIHFLAEQ